MNRLPPTTSLISFCRAAHHQSFTMAARELNLTHGAVSRSVKQLETFFGFPLFDRRNRRVYLNANGAVFYEQATRILTELQQACDSLRQQSSHARLTLSCEPSLAMRWLMPRLSEIQDRLPDRDIQLSTAGGPVDLVGQQLDMAIRRSDFSWPDDYHVTPMGREWTGPVCKPGLLTSWPPDTGITALQTRTRPSAWTDWQQQTGNAIPINTETLFDHFYFSLQAATAGMGVAIGPSQLVHDDIEQGLLVAPAGFMETETDYVILTVKDPKSDPPLEQLSAWLVSTFQQTQP